MATYEKSKTVDILNCLLLIFLILVAISCLAGLVMGLSSLYYTHSTSTKEISEARQLILSSDNADAIDSLITHMEKMQEIQQNNVTNDLMSFVYGVLSTVLVGLCLAFVEKSRSISDKAQNALNDAEKKTEEIKKVEIKILESKTNMDKSLGEMKTQVENLQAQVSTADTQASNLRDSVELIHMHSQIAFAKVALANMNRVEGNYRIKQQILDKLEYLSKDRKGCFEKNDVECLKLELERLKLEIGWFRDRADQLHKNDPEKNNDGWYQSCKDAADRYMHWIEEALEKCKELPKL